MIEFFFVEISLQSWLENYSNLCVVEYKAEYKAKYKVKQLIIQSAELYELEIRTKSFLEFHFENWIEVMNKLKV